MNKIAKVSIILPTMNMSSLLKKTIEGIALTVDVNFELIVVNNASKDDTKEYLDNIAEGILKQNPNFIRLIKLHLPTNRYLSGGINTGVMFSSAPYISIVANDILLPPKMYSFFIDILEKDKYSSAPPIGAIGPWYTEDPRFANTFYQDYDKVPKLDEWTTNWHFSVCHIVPREVWDRIGDWDEKLKTHCNDNDWGMRVPLAGYKATAYKGIVCYHAYGSLGRKQIPNEPGVAQEDSKYFFNKWGIHSDKNYTDVKEEAKVSAANGNYLSEDQKNYNITWEPMKVLDI